MINSVTLVGRLTRDPDLRYTPSGVAVANFNLAVNRSWKNQNGEYETDFINCVAWRKQAENLANFMKKGNQIGVVGSIQTRSYEGQDGKMVFVTEVLAEQISFLEPKKQQSHQQKPINAANNEIKQHADPFQGHGQPIDVSDSDLPF